MEQSVLRFECLISETPGTIPAHGPASNGPIHGRLCHDATLAAIKNLAAPSNVHKLLIALTLCVALAWPSSASTCFAAEQSPANSGTSNDSMASIESVELGLNGVWKLGQLTPVRIKLPNSLAAQAHFLRLETFDGEGVAVSYLQPLEIANAPNDSGKANDSGKDRVIWSYVTIGRSAQPFTVEVLDSDKAVLARRQLNGSEQGQVLPSGQPWIVALGSSLGIEDSSHRVAATGLQSFTTTVITEADQLPEHSAGLSGCNVLVISTTGSPPVVADVTSDQWSAINDWIVQGGYAIVSLGEYVAQMPGDSPLRRLLPGDATDRLPNINSSPLEASTATNVQLPPIVATRMNEARGVVELSMIDSSGKRFPWWVRYSRGKGVLQYFGSDLDLPVLKGWKDRKLVWDRVLGMFWSREQQSDAAMIESQSSGSTHLGYEDIIGQLRATLDYFPQARIFSFGEITFLLAIILITIGPIDYWLCVHWLQRPQLSWYFSSLVVLASSIGLVWLVQQSRPSKILTNSAQIVDFLPEERRAIVNSWTHVYSSNARTLDAQLVAPSEMQNARLDWQGLPGKGLGGMESNLLSNQGMPGYVIELGPANHSTTGKVTGVGIPTSGTKCLYGNWSQTFEPRTQSQLKELQGIDQLEGRFSNPLTVDLLRPALMYHNWIYQLPSRIKAGEELSVTYEMVPKDLMRRLNRRQIVNSNDVITKWEPDNRQSLDRVLEIMMFYKASGGNAYTGLQHRFQPRIDTSNVVSLRHAILFGELVDPLGEITLDGVSEDQVQTVTRSTWCRILLPVARAEDK